MRKMLDHLNILIYFPTLCLVRVSMLASTQYKTGWLALTLVCHHTEREKKLYSYRERDSDWFLSIQLISADSSCRCQHSQLLMFLYLCAYEFRAKVPNDRVG